jgi:hypothetical protein
MVAQQCIECSSIDRIDLAGPDSMDILREGASLERDIAVVCARAQHAQQLERAVMLETPEPDFAFGYDAESRSFIALSVQGLSVVEASPLRILLKVLPHRN